MPPACTTVQNAPPRPAESPSHPPTHRAPGCRVRPGYPIMTRQVVTGISGQAFRLWIKRLPFQPHPKWTEKH
ncbi:MAG: DUF1365 family protein [Planctomycetota bacterium]|nr:DUF1365 family protein [Planctomycetota bacterium]